MPKSSSRTAINDRLARRTNQTHQRRLDLLEKILEESSSIALNDVASQVSARQALESHSKLFGMIEELKQVELTCNPKLPVRNEQSWGKFFSWVDEENESESRISDSFKILRLNSTGNNDQECALFTKVPIKKGSKIFGIHRKTMLSSETVTKDTELFDFIKKDPVASVMQNVILVLHLLNERSKGDKSYWFPYLSILPAKILPVLELNHETLQHLLASSHIFEALKMIRAIARQYCYFFKRLQTANLPLSKEFTFQYYSWGVSVVCSRQNEIPSSDCLSYSQAIVHALIPMLDMCNHDIHSNQAVFENNRSQLISAHNLNVGDEITINYGCRSSGDFYIHNGFVPKEVPSDVVPLTITMNSEAPFYEDKVKLLRILNMPTFGSFRLNMNNYENRHKRDPHLTMFLIVYFLNENELKFILGSKNPVGLADSIYEYVQYKDFKEPNMTNHVQKDAEDLIDTFQRELQHRLYLCVKEYLSKRSSIGIALIDRSLREIDVTSVNLNLKVLLEHEKSIYESYLIKS